MAPSPKQGPQVLGLEETLTAIRLAQPKEAWAEADQVSQRCWSSFEYCQIRGWLAGWLAGWVAGWLVGSLAGWSVGWLDAGLGLVVAGPSLPHDGSDLACACVGFAVTGLGLSTLIPTVRACVARECELKSSIEYTQKDRMGGAICG